MYNQNVIGSDANAPTWGYTPIKYWPNEMANNTTVDPSGARTTDGADRLSFFAYAPYVATASADETGYGITNFTANDATTDPKVTYKVNPANTVGGAVDLLWGVAGSSDNDVKNGAQTITAGKPLVDQVKQKTNGKVTFAFKHALAGLKLTVVGAFDQVAAGGTKQAGTTVTLESVVVSANLKDKGILNLNNTIANTPLWEDAAGATTPATTFTVNSADLVDVLNYNLGTPGGGWDQTGVTASPQEVIKTNATTGAHQYFMFIPNGSATTFTVTIVYHICTVDAALALGHTDVQNTITQTLSLNPVAGKLNVINMILGLTEVKLAADVEDWPTDGDTQDVNLPINVS